MAETRLLRSAEPRHELGIPLGVIVAMYVDHNRLHSLLPMIVLLVARFRSRVRAFPRSRVRAFNGSMFWLGKRAARARLDGGERRGHMQPNTPRRKNARTRERANARTRKPQGSARESIVSVRAKACLRRCV